MRLTDDPTLPPANEPPPVPRPRKRSRRGGPGGREWIAAAGARPGLSDPSATRLVIVAMFAIVVLGVGWAVLEATREREVTDPVLSSPARKKPGTEGAQKEFDERRAFAETLFGPELFDVKDHADFAQEAPWRHALEVVSGLDDRFIGENLRFSLNLHMDEVAKDPAAFRGQFVRMRGVVGRSFRAYKLATPLAGRTDYYRGMITDPEEDSPVVFFDLLDRPPEFAMGYDTVEIDAVFYRMVEYESQPEKGRSVGTVRRAPWIVGRTLRVLAPASGPTSTATGIAVMTAFLALFFGIVYLVRRGGPVKKASGVPEAGFRSMLEERRRQRPPPPEQGREPPGR